MFNKFLKFLGLLEEKSGDYFGWKWTLRPDGFRDYYCPTCQTKLVPGPEGCGTLMAKCPQCVVLYESLPRFYDRP